MVRWQTVRSESNASDRAAALEVPAGERRERQVPDSLDLSDRARLALSGIAGSIDEKLCHHMYFFVHWDCRTPYRIHHGADSTCDPLFAETLAMLRTMSGGEEHLDIESGQWAELLSRIDGDLYWNFSDPRRPWGNSYMYAHFDGERRAEDIANVAGNGMMLRALLSRRELLGDASLDGYIQRLVGGLRRIAIHREDYSFYPDGGFGEPFNFPRSGWVSSREPMAETEGGEGSVTSYQATPLSGLVRWYRASGDEQALDLAARLARFCMEPRFWGGVADPQGDFAGLPIQIATSLPDPACVAGAEQAHWFSHGHARAWTLRALLDYGAATGDERVLEFVRRGYEYTRHHRIVFLVSGREVAPGWLGGYVVFEDLRPGAEITLQFPVHETTASHTVNSRTEMEQRYTCTFRGSTLVEIDPRDERPASYPLYRRGHLRRDEAPIKAATGFVPRKHIVGW